MITTILKILNTYTTTKPNAINQSGYIRLENFESGAYMVHISGGNVVVYTDKIKTISVPVKSIPLLIQIKGITYIEIGKKAKIK